MKSINLDSTILPLSSAATTSLLSRLSGSSLASLALTWLHDSPLPALGRKRARLDPAARNDDEDEEDSDSDLEDEEEEDVVELQAVYEEMRDSRAPKSRVVRSILRHWKSGLTYRQVAQIDVQYLKDKPTSRAWTAYQLRHDTPTPTYPTPAQLSARLRAALSPYHHHHLYLDSHPTLTILRLQLLPTTPLHPLPPPLLLLHLPSTPHLLLPSLPSSLLPILLQCLGASIASPPAKEVRELQLKGRDWRGLEEVLRGRMASGGLGKYRVGKGEGGGPLVPKTRRRVVDDSIGPAYIEGEAAQYIAQDDPAVQRAREAEVGEVFGREALPVLERLDYEISLPYPTASSSSSVPDPDATPPFLIRFEGTHVLQGLRAAVESGYADGGLPSWLGEVPKEGRNAFQVGGGEGTG